MEIREKREILKNYRHLCREVASVTELLERLWAEAERVTTIMNDIGGGKGSHDDTKLQKTIERIDETASYLLKIINQKEKKCEQIVKAIEKLDEKERIVMIKRYIEGKTTSEVAAEMCFSEVNVLKISQKAMERIEFE